MADYAATSGTWFPRFFLSLKSTKRNWSITRLDSHERLIRIPEDKRSKLSTKEPLANKARSFSLKLDRLTGRSIEDSHHSPLHHLSSQVRQVFRPGGLSRKLDQLTGHTNSDPPAGQMVQPAPPPTGGSRKISFNVSDQYDIQDVIGEGAYGVVWYIYVALQKAIGSDKMQLCSSQAFRSKGCN